jgi:AraC family transcriptional regulator of adaptative response/methylated-DNA-[protein]-cysteine methyltransferase
MEQQSQNYYRVEQAIRYLLDNARLHPSLSDLAAELHVSEFHLQRIFGEWAGISPKQFLRFLHSVSAKRLLKDYTVEEVADRLGFGSASRIYDLMIQYDAVSPGDVRSWGEGLSITWGVAPSVFGLCFSALTDRGLCKLSFLSPDQQAPLHALSELKAAWPKANLTEDTAMAEGVAAQISATYGSFESNENTHSFKVLAQGTVFQIKVWEALLAIPSGQIHTYQEVADKIGQPSAVRAVASAIAKNPIALLIPCHRVIRSTGAISQYRWGEGRKAALLLKELTGPN